MSKDELLERLHTLVRLCDQAGYEITAAHLDLIAETVEHDCEEDLLNHLIPYIKQRSGSRWS